MEFWHVHGVRFPTCSTVSDSRIHYACIIWTQGMSSLSPTSDMVPRSSIERGPEMRIDRLQTSNVSLSVL